MSHLTSSSTRRRAVPLAGSILAASAIAALAPAAAAAADGSTVLRADQGTQRPSVPQIVGGDVAGISSAPYQVRIRANTEGQPWGTAGKFTTCGGSVLDATHIVTAAHCTINPANAQGNHSRASAHIRSNGMRSTPNHRGASSVDAVGVPDHVRAINPKDR